METILKLASQYKSGQVADYILGHMDTVIAFMTKPNRNPRYSLGQYRKHNLKVLLLVSKYALSKTAYLLALGIPATLKAGLLELQLHKERDAEALVDCLYDPRSFLFTGELEHNVPH